MNRPSFPVDHFAVRSHFGHGRLVTPRSTDFKSGAYNYRGANALINDIPANRDAKFKVISFQTS